jgi:hypothetical protein
MMLCLKSWIREVVKLGGFTSPEVVAEVLNIKEGLGSMGDSNINNIQVLNKEDERLRAFLNNKEATTNFWPGRSRQAPAEPSTTKNQILSGC